LQIPESNTRDFFAMFDATYSSHHEIETRVEDAYDEGYSAGTNNVVAALRPLVEGPLSRTTFEMNDATRSAIEAIVHSFGTE
jgi:hypothetical protein